MGKAVKRARRTYHRAVHSGLTPARSAVAGFAVGMVEKSGLLDSLPKIPMIGKKGTIALAAWFWAKHGGGKLATDIANVAAALAAYQYGKDGKIDGDDY